MASSNPRAPKFEIVALDDQRRWVIVDALFERSSNSTGESFYQGKIDDPSMAQPLYIAAFPREDATMAIAWQRPRRRSTQLPPVHIQGMPGFLVSEAVAEDVHAQFVERGGRFYEANVALRDPATWITHAPNLSFEAAYPDPRVLDWYPDHADGH